MTTYRFSDAARLLGVSDDTVRRWADAGRLDATVDASGKRVVDGAVLAAFASDQNTTVVPLDTGPMVGMSARNRFTGIVTRVTQDAVMAQVEMAAGPFRLVSLMSSEAVRDLGLEPGVLAVASVKSTNVVIEVPRQT